MNFYNINGKLQSAENAKIGVTDLALLRAFGVFDYFRFVDGKPVFLEDHLQRFQNSAKLMGLNNSFSKTELKKQILTLAKANELLDVGIHIILTGGYSEDGLTPSKPNLIMLSREFVPPPKANFNKGVRLLFWEHRRDLPEVKTINYIVPIFSMKKRAEAGASDILYHNCNYISECSRSNFFMISKEGKLITPDNGILKGITRKHLLKVAKGVCEIELRDIKIEEVKNAREAFITSSSQRVMPVVQIDDFAIGNGQPGGTTIRLAGLLQKYVDELLEKEMMI